MAIVMGPVLAFQGCDAEIWRVSALVVADSPPEPLLLQGAAFESVPPELLWSVKGKAAYRYPMSIKRNPAGELLPYSIGPIAHEIAVPATGVCPRMIYTSCNGFSSLKLMKSVKDKNHLWTEVANKHAKEPYHLLLQGGDQVYADSMWETVASMQKWVARPYADANKAPLTEAMRKDIEEFYFKLYTDRWAQPEVAKMLAKVPGLRMWDDHDLIDGWGSYPPERQNCAVYGGIWEAARKAFAVFQLQLAAPEERAAFGSFFIAPDFGFSFAATVGPVAILALDMRFERSLTQVLSAEHWKAVYAWLDAQPADGKGTHLVILSSIPVVYPGFDSLETLLGFLPGHQDLEDDLADHWRSRPHKAERLRMVHRLLAAAKEKKIRPTIISGDVHVAALGVIESDRYRVDDQPVVINQLISSAIVHPGPPAAALFALRHLFDSEDEMDRGVIGRMMEFPGNGPKFIGKRNFLSLEPDPLPTKGRIWANWIVEEEEQQPYTKVLHPY